jgi:hypothetical protein
MNLPPPTENAPNRRLARLTLASDPANLGEEPRAYLSLSQLLVNRYPLHKIHLTRKAKHETSELRIVANGANTTGCPGI